LAVMTNAEAVFSEIAAQLVRGELVVKLPAARCAELVATGSSRPFDSGRGRPLREWITVGDSMAADWPALAGDAQAFVRA
jgi:hypothetical protein